MSEHPSRRSWWWLSALLSLALSIAHAQPATLADPLRPPSVVATESGAAPGMPSVTMIVIRGNRAHALIDGVVRRPGERFDGYRLDRIAATQVTLVRDDASTLTVPLWSAARALQPLDAKP